MICGSISALTVNIKGWCNRLRKKKDTNLDNLEDIWKERESLPFFEALSREWRNPERVRWEARAGLIAALSAATRH